MTFPVKLRLDLPLVLTNVDDARDRCVARLIGSLSGRPGIEEAHVVESKGTTPQLYIHYDPGIISLTRVRELLRSVGAELTSRFSHLVVSASASLHARAARSLAASLRMVPGVLEADVAVSGAVRIEYDRTRLSPQTLLAEIASLGITGKEQSAANMGSVTDAADTQPVQDQDNRQKQGQSKHEVHDVDVTNANNKREATPSNTQPDHTDHAGHDHPKGEDDHTAHDHAKGKDGHAHCGPFGEKSELIFAVLAGAFLLAGWHNQTSQN